MSPMRINKLCSETRNLAHLEDCDECDIYRGSTKPEKSCSYAVFNKEDTQWQCSVSESRCLFMPPSSTLCAKIYNEGPDAINSGEIFKTVEKFTRKIADEKGISFDKAKTDPLVQAYALHFKKILDWHRCVLSTILVNTTITMG